MQAKLFEEGRLGYHVVGEGRTSVFIMRLGTGKRQAALLELEVFVRQTSSGHACYFGNEFHDGANDGEVLEVPGLQVMALGEVPAAPRSARVRVLGRSPDDLYAFRRPTAPSSLPENGSGQRCSLAWAGPSIKIGAFAEQTHYLTEGEVQWRYGDKRKVCVHDKEPIRFCDTLVEWATDFIRKHGLERREVGVVGMCFPGPCDSSRWFSNNLSDPFQKGLALEDEFNAALQRISQRGAPEHEESMGWSECAKARYR
jgi:hypothetical protein